MFPAAEGEQKEGATVGLLHPVAALHVALREKQSKRRLLFCGKRAISARRDIAIRYGWIHEAVTFFFRWLIWE